MDVESTAECDPDVPVTTVLGVPTEGVTSTWAMEVIGGLIAVAGATGRTHPIATVNVDSLVNAVADRNVLALLRNTPLNLADGMPVLLANQLGVSLPRPVAGADLVPLLAAESERRGWQIHLLGGRPGVAERARSVMLSNNTGALITADAGPVLQHVQADGDSLAGVSSSGVDVACAVFGNPRQERLIEKHRGRLDCPVTIRIGGSLDLIVGDRRRVPAWMKRAGPELVVCAVQEPRHLGHRYPRDAKVFGSGLFRYRQLVRRPERDSGFCERVDGTEHDGILRVNLDVVAGLS